MVNSDVQVAQSGAWSPGLTAEACGTLLGIAGASVRWAAAGRASAFAWGAFAVTLGLEQRLGSFVTLLQRGDLRGCIGSLEAEGALYRSVHTNAVLAATADPRFPAVGVEEVAGLELHVSVLSPATRIETLAEFRVGQQGLIVEGGAARGVFLPEVAVAQGWTAAETAAQLCRKAGLPDGAWQAGARLTVFESIVITGAA